MLAWASAGAAQDNVCAAADQRQACSFQCCGRRSCPPSCEVDCVKRCVDACSSQTRSLDYGARKRELQTPLRQQERALVGAAGFAHGGLRTAASPTSSRQPLSSRGMIMTDLSHAPETPESTPSA